MNKKQRSAIIIGIVLISILALIPPWEYNHSQTVYRPIFTPPPIKDRSIPSIDHSRLYIPMIPVVGLTIAGVLYFKD